MKQKMFLTAVALVLLLLNLSPALCQTGVLEELDPNILWVADSAIGRIDGFAVHPNGNVFAYKGNIISEIYGADGKLVRKFTVPSESNDIESIDISDDGRYLATSYNDVIIRDLTNDVSINVGIGNLVTFSPDSKKIAFRARGGVSTGHDSSIVILDLETEQRTYIRTEELIHKIAFSPDGRFFATGGSLYTGIYPSYTSLKLWDAKTNKLIKELERIENTNYNFQKIEFSKNSKLVSFLPYNGQVSIYNAESTTLFRKYDENIYPFKSFGKFCFIIDSLIAFTSIIGPSTFLWNYINEKAYDIVSYLAQRGLNYSNELEAIIIGTNTQLIAFDWIKIISSISEEKKQTTIQTQYQKGTLTISGIDSVGNKVNIEIFDINGKLVRKLDILTNGAEIRVPLILPKGTYLLNLKDGDKEYSSKFLVTE